MNIFTKPYVAKPSIRSYMRRWKGCRRKSVCSDVSVLCEELATFLLGLLECHNCMDIIPPVNICSYTPGKWNPSHLHRIITACLNMRAQTSKWNVLTRALMQLGFNVFFMQAKFRIWAVVSIAGGWKIEVHAVQHTCKETHGKRETKNSCLSTFVENVSTKSEMFSIDPWIFYIPQMTVNQAIML